MLSTTNPRNGTFIRGRVFARTEGAPGGAIPEAARDACEVVCAAGAFCVASGAARGAVAAAGGCVD
eukprot:6009351-Pleurochrysis_carterae.AAC.1